ncbi:efflux RND transporter periplasmic adaptor subunit [Undibacterium parvum]|uniref:Efflux RND transporter periplasmic adaptor subunit n=1 Tax=Undibacterium parvum TaxID=401471 RepID=A0A3S9HGN3_9BURK|nr:efflux RND transporter periplasmic adaptor subunit [Undibacterium parvum]AZP11270.1 efflux RND transporter periplasmic adaptor subunit [Undibacterium parvum]
MTETATAVTTKPENALASKRTLKSWLSITIVGVLVLAALGYFLLPLVLGVKVKAFQLQRGELIQTVVASGRIETPARVDVGTQIIGRVAAVPVKEGQTVKAGQLLIELEASDEQAAVEQAAAALRQAEVKLRQFHQQTQPMAEQALKQAQATLLNVQKQYERQRELVAQGFIGKAQLDDVQRNLDIAKSQHSSVQLQLQSATPNGSDYQLASAALEQARANLHAAQARLAHSKIAAVADGVLILRDVERGDTVQPGKVLMVLSPLGLTQLLVQIDEKNLRYLQLGQTALAQADAYPGQKFNAQVAYINPGINAQRGSVDVKLNVAEAPVFLKQDMTVSVEIEVARRKDTLSLNVEAIRDAASKEPWVMLVEHGKAVRRVVKLGMSGDKSTEILAGLKDSDLVLPATGSAVLEGARVRADVAKKQAGR